MTKQPWMKFYPTDWRADPALRICSLTARGLWMEMLALMHDAKPRGDLLVNGQAPSAQQLASLVGSALTEVETALAELESAGVFSRRKNGNIYSRRMERDEKRTSKLRENGKKGGNPTLCNKTQKQRLDNQSVKASDKTQKPEARSQKPDITLLGFDNWWKYYPRKVSRGAAEKAFPKALRLVDLHTLIDRTKRLAANWEGKTGEELRFCKHPASWLNAKGWDDADLVPADPDSPKGNQFLAKYGLAAE